MPSEDSYAPAKEQLDQLLEETKRLLRELKGVARAERRIRTDKSRPRARANKTAHRVSLVEGKSPGPHLKEWMRIGKERFVIVENIRLVLIPAVWALVEDLEFEHPLGAQLKIKFSQLLEETPPEEPDKTSQFLWGLNAFLQELTNLVADINTAEADDLRRETITNPVSDRETRLREFVKKTPTTIAAVTRSAKLFKTNMQEWRKGILPDKSIMSRRIESVLAGRTALEDRERAPK
jgi:hypothetical protein